MKEIIQLLMRRDGLTREDAIRMVLEVRNTILEAMAQGDLNKAEDAILDELGLEPDYIMAFI